ncbi:MAG TPA: bifunctional diaminohydroxyphosphoribosylaminopyrimidine deaminase/5-amino-6-(5-phosphoribosylamino)uracil reductase RibD [Dehalococcoidales bacterium]|nr:bifunctional diaminohydroxyphosphoribosylaminopyrimidine deaminase/5-amino-6-(5-phosphoribosylamino)uracil reductase RibD [Dehalococcoidales bacterium]
MELALSLARLAQGQVSPNPAVGAVVVKNDFILGMGYTQPPGGDHAEIVALKQAGPEARGAVLYVTLEPHCHHGRTPPCTQAIIQAGIREVHFSVIDPNPKVAGKGQLELQRAGIRVVVGEHASEALVINEAFDKYITTGLPFVTAKFACSLDGKIATRSGDSKWITSQDARKQVQHMRYISDAIMTGANTIIADDPQLTVRLAVKGGITHKQPLRIIVDGQGRTPPTARIFEEPGKTLVVIGENVPAGTQKALRAKGAELLELPASNGQVELQQLLQILGKQEITSILVEAGGILLGSLFDSGLVDKVVGFLAPVIIGGAEARMAVAGRGKEKLSECPRLRKVEIVQVGPDIMVSGYVVK